jgi:hypothetical protein
MFTIPALLMWLVWQFGQDTKAKLRIVATAICILIGILGLNSFLQKAYGTANQNSTTGNFAYVLCGLTMGTTWNGCLSKLASEGKPLPIEEEAGVTLLYSLAWENFRTQPEVFFGRLTDSAVEFVTQFPDVIWKGYGTAIQEPNWLWRNSLTAVSLMGLLYIAVRRAKAVELTFLGASLDEHRGVIFDDLFRRRFPRARREPSSDCALFCNGNEQSNIGTGGVHPRPHGCRDMVRSA